MDSFCIFFSFHKHRDRFHRGTSGKEKGGPAASIAIATAIAAAAAAAAKGDSVSAASGGGEDDDDDDDGMLAKSVEKLKLQQIQLQMNDRRRSQIEW